MPVVIWTKGQLRLVDVWKFWINVEVQVTGGQ